MVNIKREYRALLCLSWVMALNCTRVYAQFLTDSIDYEDYSKFEEDLYWTNIYVNPINKDTIVIVNTTQDFYIKNKNGIKIIEGRIEGYDGHRCGCTPQKNGIWTERYENGSIKSIETFDCGYKEGQSIYYFENGNRHRVENYASPPLPRDTNMVYIRRKTFLSGTFLEYYESGEIRIRGKYEIDKEAILRNGEIAGYNFYSKKVGEWKTYDRNGKIITSEDFGH